ncbi:cell division protein SepF [Actinomadura bangladeshensis]|uniref:Cell division protein SepF n=1 Tax=Actinomadura bangladeshensis TaxID=453573 RepID=A0A4V6PA00_9ACTN|nr:cell division protein SepF [Actinomadura bangladeshensis]TDC12006.1 cell division protein SepF [Actinomadura bangladeshensis]
MIRKLAPTGYDEALHVGHFFCKGDPVLMDLTQLTDDVARQLVDFCAGLICGRGGEMERLDKKIFLLQPPARPRIAAAHIPDLAHIAD